MLDLPLVLSLFRVRGRFLLSWLHVRPMIVLSRCLTSHLLLWPLQFPNRPMLAIPPFLLRLVRLLALLSPEIIALVTQSVQAAMVAERAKSSSLPATSISSGAIRGVPAIAKPAAIVAHPSAGRPVSTLSVSVPSFLLTFTAPALPTLSLVASVASSLGGSSDVTSDIAVASKPAG